MSSGAAFGSDSGPTQMPWDTVFQTHELPNEDQNFWWRATAPSLCRLLASCGYTKEDQVSHLRWYREYVIGSLGPRPIAGQKAIFQPCPVFDGSAVEHSINWKERSRDQTVRFTIEAVGYQAGTPSDLCNQEASKELLRRLAEDIPGLDLTRFHIFAEQLFVPPETAPTVLARAGRTPLSQIWIAFDLLRGGGLLTKVYFMPILKWLETGIPTKQLVFDAVRKCNGRHGTYDAPVALLDDYLASFPPERAPVIEMVAIDCVDSPGARIKCYLRTGVNTLRKAKHQYTLGGRLRGEIVEEGVRALKELWPILFRLNGEENIEDEEVFPAGDYCGCAIEMKANCAEPETKIHIPVRKIAGTDAQLCAALAAWFERRGHGGFAAEYNSHLEAAL